MPTLNEYLGRLTPDQLRNLVRRRQVSLKRIAPVPTRRQLIAFLAAELAKPLSIAFAVSLCDERQLRALQILTSQETQPVAIGKLADVAGGKELQPVLHGIVDDLQELGLAFWDSTDEVIVPAAIQQNVPVSLPDRYNLQRCLNMYETSAVTRIYEELDISDEARSKAERVQSIRERLLRPPAGEDPRRPADEEEARVLAYLVQARGYTGVEELVEGALEGRDGDFYRYDWLSRWKTGRKKNAVDRLLARGILYGISHGYAYQLYLVIPGDLLAALVAPDQSAFWTGPEPGPEAVPESLARVQRHSGTIRDVTVLLATVSTTEVVRTNTGHIHRTNLKVISRLLTLQDERYAAFIYAACRGAGLIDVEGERQAYQVTPRADAWLASDQNAQIGALFQGWQSKMFWAEMKSEPLFREVDPLFLEGEPFRSEALSAMREPLFAVLSGLDAGTTYSMTSVGRALAYRAPLLLSSARAGAADLVSSHAAYVQRFVGECLYWLGLVESDAAVSSGIAAPEQGTAAKRGRAHGGEEKAAFRLTPLAAHLLAGAPAPADEPREDKFIVQANAEVFVPPFFDTSVLYRLLQVTEPPAKGSVGGGSRITRESVRRALDAGATDRDLLLFLQTFSRTGIPQNIEYLINEVASRHGHIHVGEATIYLQTDSPILMEELQARKDLRSFWMRPLSDTVAVVRAQDVERVLRDLRKAGYLPVDDTAGNKAGLDLSAKRFSKQLNPSGQRSPARKREPAADTIDWTRVAGDESVRLPAPAEASRPPAPPPLRPDSDPPPDAVLDRGQISQLFVSAREERQRVEVCYRPAGSENAVLRVMEPHAIVGEELSAFFPGAKLFQRLPLRRVIWARLTGDAFGK
jgi:hypothetical protein